MDTKGSKYSTVYKATTMRRLQNNNNFHKQLKNVKILLKLGKMQGWEKENRQEYGKV